MPRLNADEADGRHPIEMTIQSESGRSASDPLRGRPSDDSDLDLRGSVRRTLDQLEVGQRARVRAVTGRGRMSVRLLEMGFVPGVEVTLVKRAPLGDPLELRLRGFHVSLRRAEARAVELVEGAR